MKVLIAEDNPLDRRVLRVNLEKWDYAVEECENGTDALERLCAEDAPNLAILDWMMPGLDGPEICRRLRERKPEPYTFILLLTSRTETDDLIEGMDAGADDYITKPVNPHELQVRLRAGRRIVELQTELIEARERLREQATLDDLSGVWNRGAILDKLKVELNRARRADESVGVIMCDIDHFKSINDNHGHLSGDTVIRETAQRIERSLRDYDALGRYGGEEFLIVVPKTEVRHMGIIAERIRKAIADTPIEIEEGEISVTVSLGTYAAYVAEQVGSNHYIDAADNALYEAKRTGRNRTCHAEALPEAVTPC